MRFCLWGARAGYIQVGSAEDRWAQARLNCAAAIQRMMRKVGESVAPVMETVAQEMRAFIQAFQVREWGGMR